MSLGLAITKTDIDNIVGSYSRQILDSIYNAVKVRRQLEAMTDDQLTALTYSADEIATIRQVCADMRDAGDLFAGAAALPNAPAITVSNGDGTTRPVTPRDFSASLAKVAGFRS